MLCKVCKIDLDTVESDKITGYCVACIEDSLTAGISKGICCECQSEQDVESGVMTPHLFAANTHYQQTTYCCGEGTTPLRWAIVLNLKDNYHAVSKYDDDFELDSLQRLLELTDDYEYAQSKASGLNTV